MGFMHVYKRLDNLCRDMNGIGVTGYIEDMEHTPNGIRLVPGWNNDYLKLKHYRHIRNLISHEIDADEGNMCSYEDEKWMENFYNRIMVQNDALALYHKATLPRPASKSTTVEAPQKLQYRLSYDNTDYTARKPQYIPANDASKPTHEPQYMVANNNTSESMHKPQYIPDGKADKHMRKSTGYGIIVLLTMIVLVILIYAILFSLFD